MTKPSALYIFSLLLVFSAYSKEYCWYGEALSQWQGKGTMQASLQEGILSLKGTENGACIDYAGPTLDLPGDLHILEIEYRAIDVPSKNNGFLMFGVSGTSYGKGGGRRWFENIRVTQDFQILRLELDDVRQSWSSCQNIDKLRICIPQQAPFDVEIRCIRLLPRRPALPPHGESHHFPIDAMHSGSAMHLRLPAQDFDVYLECRGTTAPACSFSPQLMPAANLKTIPNGYLTYIPAGRFSGGDISITPPQDASICGVVFTSGVPSGAATIPFYPTATSEIRQSLFKADLPFHYYSGYMVRAPGDTPSSTGHGKNQFLFRQDFDLPAGYQAVQLQLSADDHYVLFWNGSKILESHTPDGWRLPKKRDITVFCHPGRNRMEGIYHNSGGPGGVLYELEWIDAEGKYHSLGSDQKLLFAPKVRNDWQPIQEDNALFSPGVLQSTPPNPPWTTVLPFHKLSLVLPAEVRQQRIHHENSRDYWEFHCPGQNDAVGKKIQVSLFSPRGMDIYQETLTLTREMLPDHGLFRLPIRLPQFYPSGKLVLRANTKEVAIPPALTYEFDFDNPRLAKPHHDFRIIDGIVHRDGKAVSVAIGNTFHNFAEAGYHKIPFKFRAVWTSSMPAIDWWIGENQYDFSVVDAKVEACLQVDPNVEIFLFAGINPPAWWGEKHPDALARYADGSLPPVPLAPVSFASEQFRQDSARAMQALVRHVQGTPYADKIAGYLLDCGYTAEWQHWDSFRGNGNRMLDYSEPARQAFAEFMKQHAPGLPAILPSPVERLKAGNGLFLDPEMDRNIILHSQFHSEIIADSITNAAHLLREEAGDGQLIAVYYGYPLEFANMGLKLHNAGHNALAKILACRDIDMILSPPSYGVRNLGESGEDMKPFASIRASNKLSIIDDDTRTHLINRPVGFFQTINAEQTQNILRRNFGRTLCRQEPLCCYALTSGNEFSSQKILQDIKTTMAAMDFALESGVKSAAEIAVVVSERANNATAYTEQTTPETPELQEYTPDGNVRIRPRLSQPVMADLVYYQRNNLARLGAPADWFLAEDIRRVAKRPYKLWIFLNIFHPDQSFCQALDTIRNSNVKLLFIYSAGGLKIPSLAGIPLQKSRSPMKARLSFPDVSHPLLQYMRSNPDTPQTPVAPLFHALCDSSTIPLGYYPDGTVGCALKHNTVFFGNPRLSPDFARSVASWSNIHIFCDTNDVLYANHAFVTIHAVSSGKKTLRFPNRCDVIDVFEKKLLGRDVFCFEFEMDLHESKVFYYGSDGETLLEKLSQSKL